MEAFQCTHCKQVLVEAHMCCRKMVCGVCIIYGNASQAWETVKCKECDQLYSYGNQRLPQVDIIVQQMYPVEYAEHTNLLMYMHDVLASEHLK